MKERKLDTLQLIMQPYNLDILTALSSPKRFNDLIKYVKNRKTLSLKLPKLMEHGLIEDYPFKTEKGYVNSYVISKKGKELIKKLNKLIF
jgi:DNA-binding HxlR family transcriptional regulator